MYTLAPLQTNNYYDDDNDGRFCYSKNPVKYSISLNHILRLNTNPTWHPSTHSFIQLVSPSVTHACLLSFIRSVVLSLAHPFCLFLFGQGYSCQTNKCRMGGGKDALKRFFKIYLLGYYFDIICLWHVVVASLVSWSWLPFTQNMLYFSRCWEGARRRASHGRNPSNCRVCPYIHVLSSFLWKIQGAIQYTRA